MVLNIECPWCDETVWLTREDLGGEIECSACDIRFELAPAELEEIALAA